MKNGREQGDNDYPTIKSTSSILLAQVLSPSEYEWNLRGNHYKLYRITWFQVKTSIFRYLETLFTSSAYLRIYIKLRIVDLKQYSYKSEQTKKMFFLSDGSFR